MRLDEFYQEEPGGSFTHDGEEYYLNPLLRHTEEYPVQDIPVSELEWITKDQEPEEFEYADTEVPILVTPWEDKIVVIDGYHRLLKAIDRELEKLPAKVVPTSVLARFKKSDK